MQNVHVVGADDPEEGVVGHLVDQRRHFVRRDFSRGGDGGGLAQSVGDGDVGVEAGAGGGDSVGRDDAGAVGFAVGGDALLDVL